jgi:hypothetical protein
MRSSLLKLRESSSVCNISAAGGAGAAAAQERSSSSSSSLSNPIGSASTTGGSSSGGDRVFGSGGGAGDLVEGLHASRWMHHVSAVLRGAVTTADSLLMCHPVLGELPSSLLAHICA